MQLDVVDGKLTARTAAAFCQAVDDALRHARAIVVAAESVKDVDAVGLAVLLHASRRAASAGVDFSSTASPLSVIRAVTCLLSSGSRSRWMRPRSSVRSSRRDTSGTLETSRSATSRPHIPFCPAPRRIRSTLYCVVVIP